MTNEELQLLRENNIMLKQIVAYLTKEAKNKHLTEYLINVLANKSADKLPDF